MLSSVLNSERAIQVKIEIMRAFVRLREMIATHKDLARKKIRRSVQGRVRCDPGDHGPASAQKTQDRVSGKGNEQHGTEEGKAVTSTFSEFRKHGRIMLGRARLCGRDQLEPLTNECGPIDGHFRNDCT